MSQSATSASHSQNTNFPQRPSLASLGPAQAFLHTAQGRWAEEEVSVTCQPPQTKPCGFSLLGGGQQSGRLKRLPRKPAQCLSKGVYRIAFPQALHHPVPKVFASLRSATGSCSTEQRSGLKPKKESHAILHLLCSDLFRVN